jgi:hypothetical protein
MIDIKFNLSLSGYSNMTDPIPIRIIIGKTNLSLALAMRVPEKFRKF